MLNGEGGADVECERGDPVHELFEHLELAVSHSNIVLHFPG